jgi:hypothetical protein
MKMSNIKRTVLLIGAPAILAVGGLSAMAASAPTATATPSQQEQTTAEPSGPAADVAESVTEPANTAAEAAAEPKEPALPGGGHADAADQNVDSQLREFSDLSADRTGRCARSFLFLGGPAADAGLHVAQEFARGLIRALVHLAEGLDQGESLFMELGEQVQDRLDISAEVIQVRLNRPVSFEFSADSRRDSRWCAHTKETYDGRDL